jgi:hypothetical protein
MIAARACSRFPATGLCAVTTEWHYLPVAEATPVPRRWTSARREMDAG